ncbi:MAG: hypothetical protein COX17_01690 [Deltaproteobacteria bacterium CG23_combo_of_CG06-09_8_20_14_all_60_8]|nr:MAG: hypothetical protein AUK28_11260 [Desulfobacterales bacterium CG2_30_60_27]PIP44396.1 MAG: hypothetical protein COX17_01690 [Deltaproteobacteria bacterium CG23_combo_of_CG06-09_8_20_14_all_60_8]
MSEIDIDGDQENSVDIQLAKIQSDIMTKQKQRGLQDWRLPIVVIASIFFIKAIITFNLWSILLIAGTVACMAVGIRVQKAISKIDNEITAANSLLVELLKHKIVGQLPIDG